MVKECMKKCSSCGHNGHNARSCGGGSRKNKEICVKLFGFKIHVPRNHEPDESSSAMRKSKSTPNLNDCNTDHTNVDAGYVSDGPGVCQKKKAVPWTEDEHLSFLSGLEKLGRGDWKGISMNFVHSRTPTQVASHAQKYFKRLNLPDKRNRRSSLFDISRNELEIKHYPHPEPPDAAKEEHPKLVDNLPALDLNTNGDTEEQANTLAKATATSLAAPPALPYTPCYGVPNFNQMPYIPMMGMTNNGQIFPVGKSFPAMPSVPMMYIPNPAYFYLPESPGSQSSNTLLKPKFAHGSSSPMARP